MKTVVGVIPARFASTRFPGKPLASIQGKPMIEWVVKGAKSSKLLNEVIVATDDERIAQAAKAAGAVAVLTDSDLPSGTDRIAAALWGKAADIVVNIQGDEPLIRASMLDELVEPLLKDDALEMSTLATLIKTEDLENPNIVKVVTNFRGDALYFSRFPIPHSRQKGIEPACLRHVGLYAYQRHFLEKFCGTPPSGLETAESLEQLRALEMGARIRVVKTTGHSQGVDTPEDLARIEAWLKSAK